MLYVLDVAHVSGMRKLGRDKILRSTGDLDELKEQAWCNFEFLLARLHSSSVHSLLNDLDLTLANVLDADIHLVLQAVIASIRVLAMDPLQLASELIGRLRQLKGISPFHSRYPLRLFLFTILSLLSFLDAISSGEIKIVIT